MIKNILFDLDGTLLPVNQDEFVMKVMSVMEDELKKTDLDSSDFMKGMLKGIDSIVKENDGTRTNEALFWDVFSTYYTSDLSIAKTFFERFYSGAFLLATEVVQYDTKIADTVTFLKNKGYNLVLATSPVFPEIAIHERMTWNDVFPEDFTYISTFENSCFAKPSLGYYKEIIEKLSLDPRDTIMVGNDVHEDGIIEDLGFDCYIITDFLVNRQDKEITTKWSGSFHEFHDLITQTF